MLSWGREGSSPNRLPFISSVGAYHVWLVYLMCTSALACPDELSSAIVAALDGTDPIIAGDLLSHLSGDDPISKEAVEALVSHLNDERAAEILPDYAPVGPDTIADRAMHALARIREPDSVPLLCDFLDRCDVSEPRMRAMWVLRRLGPLAEGAVPCVKTLVTASDDPRIRERAILTMSAITANAEELLAPFQDALKDEDPDVISAAVVGLGILDNRARGAVGDLVPLLKGSRYRSYGISRDAATVSPLRVDVAMTLGHIGEGAESALPTLRDMLDSDDSRVRVAAAFAVCRITNNPDPGLSILLRALKSTEESQSWAARICAAALGQLGYAPFRDEAVAALRGATEHPDSAVRLAAIRSLASIAPSEIVIATIRPLAAGDPSSVVRLSALEALQRFVALDPSLLDLFIDALRAVPGDEGFMLGRDRVAEMLGEMGAGAEGALSVLRDRAGNDKQPAVRKAARKAIDKISQELTGRSKCDGPADCR